MSRLLIILSLAAILFPWASAHAQNAPLVNVFCVALLEAERDGVSPLEMDWPAIGRRMESASVFPTVEDKPFSDCVSLYSPQFEEAEFLLGGKRLLEAEMEKAKSAPVSMVIRPTAELHDPWMGKVLLAGEEGPAPLAIAELEARHRSYQVLWGDFLLKMRAWFHSTRTSAQVVQKPSKNP